MSSWCNNPKVEAHAKAEYLIYMASTGCISREFALEQILYLLRPDLAK